MMSSMPLIGVLMMTLMPMIDVFMMSLMPLIEVLMMSLMPLIEVLVMSLISLMSLEALMVYVLQVLMMSLSLVASQISYFPENANALLDAGLLHSLPHLFAYDYRHPLTPVAVQLLWNLLDFAAVATRVRGGRLSR
eukprot:1140266-Pelagomonas_calceolata.AAC.11